MDSNVIVDKTGLKHLLMTNYDAIQGWVGLEIDGLSDFENQKYERLINARLRECGCEMGAVFAFIALGGIFTWCYMNSGIPISTVAKSGSIVLLCAALAGKLLGLLVSKWRLRWTIRKLLTRLDG